MTIAREEGVMKLWSGATATTIRQGSNQMSLFWGKALCDGIFFDKHVSGITQYTNVAYSLWLA
jgi:solute carrier family 25 citrate transporter 1